MTQETSAQTAFIDVDSQCLLRPCRHCLAAGGLVQRLPELHRHVDVTGQHPAEGSLRTNTTNEIGVRLTIWVNARTEAEKEEEEVAEVEEEDEEEEEEEEESTSAECLYPITPLPGPPSPQGWSPYLVRQQVIGPGEEYRQDD